MTSWNLKIEQYLLSMYQDVANYSKVGLRTNELFTKNVSVLILPINLNISKTKTVHEVQCIYITTSQFTKFQWEHFARISLQELILHITTQSSAQNLRTQIVVNQQTIAQFHHLSSWFFIISPIKTNRKSISIYQHSTPQLKDLVSLALLKPSNPYKCKAVPFQNLDL